MSPRVSPNIPPILRKKMEDKGWDPYIKVLAEKVGINPGSLRNNLNSSQKMNIGTLRKIIEVFDYASASEVIELIQELDS